MLSTSALSSLLPAGLSGVSLLSGPWEGKRVCFTGILLLLPDSSPPAPPRQPCVCEHPVLAVLDPTLLLPRQGDVKKGPFLSQHQNVTLQI